MRGFGLFSMLANLAEDREAASAGATASFAQALAQLRAHGIGEAAIGEMLDRALVVPVLTAHPPEVRRAVTSSMSPTRPTILIPIAEIAPLVSVSRPASRKPSSRIADQRAIAWVLSWSEGRVMLPGWYGVGDALAGFADKKLLQAMAQEWPLFRNALANMERVLAKSDMAIAAEYATLVKDQALAAHVFGPIRDGWQREARRLTAATARSPRGRSA